METMEENGNVRADLVYLCLLLLLRPKGLWFSWRGVSTPEFQVSLELRSYSKLTDRQNILLKMFYKHFSGLTFQHKCVCCVASRNLSLVTGSCTGLTTVDNFILLDNLFILNEPPSSSMTPLANCKTI